MTTIAYRSGTMASDGRTTGGGMIVTDATRKLVLSRCGTKLGGASGRAIDGEEFLRWVEKGAKGSAPEGDYWGLLITPRYVRLFVSGHPTGRTLPWEGPFAIGSGAAAALGALHMGASPREAVVVAAKVDSSSGGEIMELSLCNDKKQEKKKKKEK